MSLELIIGIGLGYILGVIKEKARWIEKFISGKLARQIIEEKE